jgi:hypothetical protein
MLFRNKYLNKAISAALLVMLLLIHSVKLLHTHSSVSSHDVHKNSFFLNSNADCTICDYQLYKDADNFVYTLIEESRQELTTANTQLILSYKYSFHTVFETRGPPVVLSF